MRSFLKFSTGSNEEAILKNLYKSSFKFLNPLTSEETYPIICLEAKKLLNCQYCSIYIKKEDKLEKVHTTFGKLYEIKIQAKDYTYKAFKSRNPLVIDIERVERTHPRLKDMGIKSTVLIPLVYKKEAIGVLSADYFEKKKFSKRDYSIIKLFTTMATLAVRKAQLNSELQESIETRNLFISLASHELRTPITTIYSYAHLIDSAISKRKIPNRKWMNIVKWELTRLISMVNELFQMDQLKKGQLEYHWKSCSLLKVIKRVMVNFKVKYPKHKLIFKNQVKIGEDFVLADFDKLMQAVSNILNNAAKFSKSGSKIVIWLSREEANLKLVVEDQGTGIPKKDLPKVFEGFYKGSQSKREGLGIGLYLTKTIVEIHRGRINVVSSEGKGTRVEVRLPYFS